MKQLLSLLLFLNFSSVLASTEPEAAPAFVDSPAKCFAQKVYPCSLKAVRNFLSFERESQSYHLGEKSAVLFLAPSEVQLMQGEMWIRKSNDLKVKLSSALTINVSGEWLVEKSKDSTTLFRNLGGDAQFISKFVFDNEALPVGYQNWFGGLSTKGEISRGVIRPIALTDFLKAWIPLAGLPIAEIKRRTTEFRESWSQALDQSAEFYSEVIERRMASHADKARAQQLRQKAAASERAQLKKMYYEKNGL